MLRLVTAWNNLQSSLWFIPGLLMLGAILLAMLTIEIDNRIDHEWLARFPRLFGAGAEGSRSMLNSIATSMITVAALVFSITVSALSQASTQYTPRILRSFMSDRANQFVLGTFSGIFAFCLIVLRTVRGDDDGNAFIPGVSVVVAFVLAIVGVGVLIYFIHHVAVSLQAGTVVSRAAEDIIKAICHVFPERSESKAQKLEENTDRQSGCGTDVQAARVGYIQSVDAQKLVDLARNLQARLECLVDAGDFVNSSSVVVRIFSPKPAKASDIQKVQACFVCESHRTVEQDPRFGVRQIVDIALKALSPAVADPTMATMCVQYLTAVLVVAAERGDPSGTIWHDGKLRLVRKVATFEDLLRLSFDEIARASEGNFVVSRVMVLSLREIACAARETERESLVARYERAWVTRLSGDLAAADRRHLLSTRSSASNRQQ